MAVMLLPATNSPSDSNEGNTSSAMKVAPLSFFSAPAMAVSAMRARASAACISAASASHAIRNAQFPSTSRGATAEEWTDAPVLACSFAVQMESLPTW